MSGRRERANAEEEFKSGISFSCSSTRCGGVFDMKQHFITPAAPETPHAADVKEAGTLSFSPE